MAGQAAMLGLASVITANPPAAPLSSLTTPDTPSPMPTLLLPDMFGFAGSGEELSFKARVGRIGGANRISVFL